MARQSNPLLPEKLQPRGAQWQSKEDSQVVVKAEDRRVGLVLLSSNSPPGIPPKHGVGYSARGHTAPGKRMTVPTQPLNRCLCTTT